MLCEITLGLNRPLEIIFVWPTPERDGTYTERMRNVMEHVPGAPGPILHPRESIHESIHAFIMRQDSSVVQMCCGTNSHFLACIANTWNCRIGTQRNVSPGTMLFPICGSVVPERDGAYQYDCVCEETMGVLTRNLKERMENTKKL